MVSHDGGRAEKHGTTQKRQAEVFREEELSKLLHVPDAAYDEPQYGDASVAHDQGATKGPASE